MATPPAFTFQMPDASRSNLDAATAYFRSLDNVVIAFDASGLPEVIAGSVITAATIVVPGLTYGGTTFTNSPGPPPQSLAFCTVSGSVDGQSYNVTITVTLTGGVVYERTGAISGFVPGTGGSGGGVIPSMIVNTTSGGQTVVARARTDGVLELTPAPGTIDGTKGITASTPDLGTFGTNSTALLSLTAGMYQHGSPLEVRHREFSTWGPTFYYEGYSTTAPMWFHRGVTIYQSATLCIGNVQDMTTGLITPGTNYPHFLTINPDTQGCISTRANAAYDGATLIVHSHQDYGGSDAPDAGSWKYMYDGNGTWKYGTLAASSHSPLELNDGTFGWDYNTNYWTFGGSINTTIKATNGILNIQDTVIRMGSSDLGAMHNIYSTTAAAAIAAQIGGVVNFGVMVNITAANVLTGGTVLTAYKASGSTDVALENVLQQNGNGFVANVLLAVGSGDAFDIYQKNGGASWSAGLTQASSNEYRISPASNLSGSSPIRLSTSGGIGFNNATPVAKGTITGSKSSNTALANLLTYLASRGDVTDSTT